MTRVTFAVVAGGACVAVIAFLLLNGSAPNRSASYTPGGAPETEADNGTSPTETTGGAAATEESPPPINSLPFEEPDVPSGGIVHTRSVHRTSDLPPEDREFYEKVSYVLDVPWWEVYDIAEGNDKKRQLREAWTEVWPTFVTADLTLNKVRTEANEARVAAGQFERVLPERVIDANGREAYVRDPDIAKPMAGEQVMLSTKYDRALKRAVTRVVRIAPGENRELDEALTATAQLKSSMARRFRSILGTSTTDGNEGR